MKKVLVFFLLASILSPYFEAQHQKEYTNFADTTFHINEVVVKKKRLPKVEALKLNVSMEFVPISTNTLPGEVLHARNINEIQGAVCLIPGMRMSTDIFKSILVGSNAIGSILNLLPKVPVEKRLTMAKQEFRQIQLFYCHLPFWHEVIHLTNYSH